MAHLFLQRSVTDNSRLVLGNFFRKKKVYIIEPLRTLVGKIFPRLPRQLNSTLLSFPAAQITNQHSSSAPGTSRAKPMAVPSSGHQNLSLRRNFQHTLQPSSILRFIAHT